MKKSIRCLLATILSLSIFLGGLTMSFTTVTAAVSSSETALSLEAAKEGIVLFKNDNNCLPLASTDRKIALFGGAGAMRTGTTGTGAESNRPGYTISIHQGLKNKGFTFTSESWLQDYDAEYAKGFAKWTYTPWDHFRLAEPAISESDLATAAKGATTAVYVVRRLAGEGTDRKNEKGDYILTDIEKSNLTAIAETFDKVVLILNTCGPIDMTFLNTITNIDAILYISLPGMEAGNAVASVLVGETNPSGKLSATWAKNYASYPSAKAFQNTSSQVLSEDIYVGYRWFETFAGESDKVLYPFGYGLSYTTFAFSDQTMNVDENGIVHLSVKVTNTGKVAGKEVVQIYYGAPQGELGKPAVNLIAYKKTEKLVAKQSQTLTFEFAVKDMASYDDEGLTGNPSCYVLEAGDYPIYIGNSSADAKNLVAGTYHQDELEVTQQLTRYGSPIRSFSKTINTENGKKTVTVKPKESTANAVPSDFGLSEMTNNVGYDLSFEDVLADPRLIDDYIGQFDTDILTEYVRLVQGKGAGILGGYNLESGTPELAVSDGVCGLNYENTRSASYPCPTCLAQTFNDELVTEVAAAVADQFITFGYDGVLAPGVNIQQNPLCGRNFGYFSEDPLLSGNMGAAYVRGVQSKGICATPKHFAVNNKEDGRQLVDSVLTERALREIYLKSFQITVEKGEPWTIMTSYNKVNGVEVAERSDLINGILRNEWGFDGTVTTDWSNDSDEIVEKFAGCDLNCYGIATSAEIVYDAVESNQLSKTCLQVAAKNILKTAMKSYQNQKNGIYAGIQTVYMDNISTIEAEAFNTKSNNASDVQIETCNDGNGRTVINANNGDVLYYALNVELAGTYRFTARAATIGATGSLTLAVDGKGIGTTPVFTATGSKDTYADQPYVDVTLPQGECQLAITCQGSGYNLNHFTLEPVALANTIRVIQRPEPVAVDYNTPADKLVLPKTVDITLSNGTTVTTNVTWNTDGYNQLHEGAQTISGTIALPNNVYNTQRLLAFLTLEVKENPNPVTSVKITNLPTSLAQGESYKLTVAVEGEGDFIKDVVWSTNSYTSTITPEGLLTIGQRESASYILVTVASATDDSVKQTKSITVTKSKTPISGTEPTRLFGIDYDNSSRVFNTEECSDETGGKNICDFNSNAFIEFECKVLATGTYTVSFRYAASTNKSGNIKLLVDGTNVVESGSLPYTGGWQKWASTKPITMNLTRGEHIIKLIGTGTGYNFNYIELVPVDVEPTYKVTGTVQGTNDLGSVKVQVTGPDTNINLYCEKDGTFTVADLVAGEYTFTFSGKDIQTYTQTVQVNANKTIDVTVTPAFMLGDLDGNESITASDALMILKNVVGKVKFDETQTIQGDLDGNGSITANDALLILKKVVGKIDKFPVEA